MRETKLISLCLILVLTSIHASGEKEPTLIPTWNYPISGGVDLIYLSDFDNNSRPEVYVISHNPSESRIYVLDSMGRLGLTVEVPRSNAKQFPSEKITLLWVGDLDGDNSLDVIAASEIHYAALNTHRLYRIERGYDHYKNRYESQLRWWYEKSGLTTSINVADIDGDGLDDIITSSDDGQIRAFDTEGNVIKNYTSNGSIWDASLVDLDNDTEIELVAGGYNKIFALKDWSVWWWNPVETRFSKVRAEDVGGGGRPEVFAISENNIFSFDMYGSLKWNYSIQDLSENIAASDVDEDGLTEVLVFSKDNQIHALSGEGVLEWKNAMPYKITSIYAGDLYGDGRQYLMVGAADGLHVYELNKTMSKTAQANGYYARALKLFSNESFDEALNETLRAKGIYTKLRNTTGISNCDILLSNIAEVMVAENYYQTALKLHTEGEFDDALEYLINASDIYRRINHTRGLAKTDSLISVSKIDLDFREEVKNAEEYHNAAEKYYVNSSFREALEYARKAREIYAKYNYSLGVVKTESLISLCEKNAGKPIDEAAGKTTSTTLKQEVEAIPEQNQLFYGMIGLGAIILIASIILWAKKRR